VKEFWFGEPERVTPISTPVKTRKTSILEKKKRTRSERKGRNT